MAIHGVVKKLAMTTSYLLNTLVVISIMELYLLASYCCIWKIVIENGLKSIV